VFVPEIAELPDAWPACRTAHCGSTVAVARVDAPFGPVTVLCENGHHRAYRSAARNARERRIEPGERRRAEVLEDAERCALCGTPPAEHPYRPDLALRSDRDLLAWLQRWRPQLYTRLLEALAIVSRGERVTAGTWRLRIPANLREAITRELSDSALQADHLVPAARLERLVDVLTKRELDFAVNCLLVAICRACDDGRWRAAKTRDDYLREYVRALHDGDERLARADAAGWKTMDVIASRAARVQLATDERSA
jgi:hypothetical protein